MYLPFYWALSIAVTDYDTLYFPKKVLTTFSMLYRTGMLFYPYDAKSCKIPDKPLLGNKQNHSDCHVTNARYDYYMIEGYGLLETVQTVLRLLHRHELIRFCVLR